MKIFPLLTATAGLVAAITATPSAAATYMVTVVEASGMGSFDAVSGSAAKLNARADVSHASFTYTGPLDFANNAAQSNTNTGDLTSTFFGANASGISNYQGSGPATVVYGANGANFSTLSGFLATSGSSAGYDWGSLYTFDSLPGTYGSDVLTIRHDDGVAVYVDGTRLSGTTAGPTAAVTEKVTLPANASSYSIVYSRENGSASILNTTLSGPGLNVSAVPEPASWAMMIVGVGAVGGSLRRRRQAGSPKLAMA